MRKNVLIALTLAATFFGACAQTSKTSRTKTRSHGKSAELSSVALRRGACFGRCPEYTLTIKSDGMVIYDGRRNAPTQGVYQKNIGAATAGKLLAEFRALRVDTLKSNYTANIADLPGMNYTFVIGGTEKSVGNANFGPEFLIEMAEKVDAYGKVDATWKKTASYTQEQAAD